MFSSQSLSWTNVHAEVPQESILGPLSFLIYINDLSDNFLSTVKLFADDTLIFSVVHDVNTFSKDISSRPEVFCKKGVLRNFAKFTGKHLYQRLFFDKVAGLRPGVFLRILRNFYSESV